ncbi:MAG: zinc-ribbon domain-containing protein, partial [Chloroflexales bacterium]|nr:zinc-ribbon domain-containing protein [Chloroflexales bacterium]
MTTCPTCGAQNDPGNRFCDQCGTRLGGDSPSAAPATPATPAAASSDQPTVAAPVCPSCGATVLPGEAFCDSCGADLLTLMQGQGAPAAAVAPPASAAPSEAPTIVVTPAPAAEGMCKACGAPLLPGERFCDNCGADVQSLATGGTAAPEKPAAEPVTGPNDATVLAVPIPAQANEPAAVSPDDATVLATPPPAEAPAETPAMPAETPA